MKIILILVVSIVLTLLIFYASTTLGKEDFSQKRTRILNELSLAIEEAKSQGNYNCCINPPCTMCYLGNWIWKDGICRCDEMVKNGEFDKVCPQCKEG